MLNTTKQQQQIAITTVISMLLQYINMSVLAVAFAHGKYMNNVEKGMLMAAFTVLIIAFVFIIRKLYVLDTNTTKWVKLPVAILSGLIYPVIVINSIRMMIKYRPRVVIG